MTKEIKIESSYLNKLKNMFADDEAEEQVVETPPPLKKEPPKPTVNGTEKKANKVTFKEEQSAEKSMEDGIDIDTVQETFATWIDWTDRITKEEEETCDFWAGLPKTMNEIIKRSTFVSPEVEVKIISELGTKGRATRSVTNGNTVKKVSRQQQMATVFATCNSIQKVTEDLYRFKKISYTKMGKIMDSIDTTRQLAVSRQLEDLEGVTHDLICMLNSLRATNTEQPHKKPEKPKSSDSENSPKITKMKNRKRLKKSADDNDDAIQVSD